MTRPFISAKEEDVPAATDYVEEPTLDSDQQAMAGGEWKKADRWGDGGAYAQAAKLAALEDAESLELLKQLLPKLTNLDRKEPQRGETLLLTATVAGNAAGAELLLEQKADVNLTNDAGFTPLMAAARLGSGNCVRMLCIYKADVMAELPDGRCRQLGVSVLAPSPSQ